MIVTIKKDVDGCDHCHKDENGEVVCKKSLIESNLELKFPKDSDKLPENDNDRNEKK